MTKITNKGAIDLLAATTSYKERSPDTIGASQMQTSLGLDDFYLICTPEIARLITSRWISDVPSKIW